MGLDTVELVLAVEDSFGISITDADAEQIRTVGQFHACILRKLNCLTEPPARCLTAMAFYRLRAAIVELTGARREDVRPSTPLDAVVPLWGRQRVWDRMACRMRLVPPALRRPSWLTDMLVYIGAAALVAPFVVLPLFGGGALLELWAATAAVISLTVLFTTPIQSYVEGRRGVSVGDVSRLVLQRNVRTLADRAGGLREREIWQALVGIVSDELGVQADEVGPDSRFVEDLNCG